MEGLSFIHFNLISIYFLSTNANFDKTNKQTKTYFIVFSENNTLEKYAQKKIFSGQKYSKFVIMCWLKKFLLLCFSEMIFSKFLFIIQIPMQ